MTIHNDKLRAYGITLFRLIVGAIFVMHGGQKLFVYGHAGVAGGFAQMGIPAAGFAAWLVALVEFVGGLALITGFGTRLVAIPLAIDMIGAIGFVHAKAGFFLPNGYEFALVLLVASAGLALTGSGALSLDNVIARIRSEPQSATVAREHARRRAA